MQDLFDAQQPFMLVKTEKLSRFRKNYFSCRKRWA